MQTVLIVLHLRVVIALVATVLLQRSEGGALGVGGGGGFMTGRGQANALTRATAILGTLFFVTSLGLTLLAHYNRAPKSIIDQIPQATRSQPATTLPAGGATPLDQLRQLEQQKDGGTPPTTSTQTLPAPPPAPAGPEVPKSQ